MQYKAEYVVNRIDELESKIERKKSEIDALESEKAYAESLREKILEYDSSGIVEIPELSDLYRERDQLQNEISLLEETNRPTQGRKARLELVEAMIERTERILKDLRPFQAYYNELRRR
ncbi:MAG: hypothetical protein ACXQTM_05020 [Methanosarcinales archaeon]